MCEVEFKLVRNKLIFVVYLKKTMKKISGKQLVDQAIENMCLWNVVNVI